VQPPAGRPRPIVSETRPTGPLVYERLSDPILVRRAKDGDKQALDALCVRHAPRVERICLHVLRDPEDARDASQEALAKLVQRIGQFRGQSQFTTWLHRLTVNTCKDVAQSRFRTQRRTEPLLEDPREAVDHDPERELAASETRRELARSLAELPRAQAQVVALKDAFDLPFEQIAEVTGLPVGTAKCYAHRGRNGLRARLSA
jgi:RNA polymerase sigma-70 factor (ECF subfamily)